MKNLLLAALLLVSEAAYSGESIKLMLEHNIQPVEGLFGVIRLVNTEGQYRGCRYTGFIPKIESKADASKAKSLTITRRFCSDGSEASVDYSILIYPPFIARAGDVIVVNSK